MPERNGKKILGNNIRKHRKMKGMTIVELAGRVHPDGDFYSHLSRIELGKLACSVETIFSIAHALQIKPSELLEIEDSWQEAVNYNIH
ncbi:helix-turn-helix domain-containing protein [Pedobacter antarcticus]|nr:helix-turn-helix transcriptional regulator [Pedobacter antarcticus]SDM38213.1 Helix-turn-helix domain-containing protein [Pedobacter antarcticus]SFE94232.1 Helix-turn-helix domain-containing protein [Pedobacter antarcticus]